MQSKHSEMMANLSKVQCENDDLERERNVITHEIDNHFDAKEKEKLKKKLDACTKKIKTLDAKEKKLKRLLDDHMKSKG